MDFVYCIAKLLNESPFDILKMDAELVIMWMNFFIEKGEEEIPQKQNVKTKDQPNRVRVNDKTATGGWF